MWSDTNSVSTKSFYKEESWLNNPINKNETAETIAEILKDNPTLRLKKVILLDLYWTLIWRPNSLWAIKKILKRIWKVPYKTFYKIVQTNKKEKIKEQCKVSGYKISKAARKLFSIHTKKEVNWASLYLETLDFLNKLKEQWYKIGLISNISEDFSKPLRDKIPDGIFDIEVLSYLEWVMKPELFEKLVNNPEIDIFNEYDIDDILMIWDSLKDDVNWAKNVWMSAILLDRNAKKMYYDKEKNLIIIHTLYDLLDILWINHLHSNY